MAASTYQSWTLSISNIESNNKNNLNKDVSAMVSDATNSTSNDKHQAILDTAEKIREMKESNSLSDVSTNNVTGNISNNKSSQPVIYAWDPRLGRVDGFMVTNNDNESVNPLIIPFATNTAASAYYNMVFSIESAVYNELNKAATSPNVESSDQTSSKNVYGDLFSHAISTTGSASDKVMVQNSTTEKIKKDSNLYGVASVVNPYTLTKLCGALTIGNDTTNGVNVTENRLYDIRDTRRFYDNTVNKSGDFTSVSNPTTTNIITWSNKDPWGRTPYSFLDFVFCKYWNIIPNNRLITFRKYHAPVYDNLLFPGMYTEKGEINKEYVFAPIATVLTYFGEQTGNTLSNLFLFTTGTKWKDIPAAVHEVTGDTGDNTRAVIDRMFTNGGGFSGAESNFFKGIINGKGGANWITGKMFSFGKFMGLLDKDGYDIKQDLAVFEKLDPTKMDPQDLLYSNRILGPVNRIDSTKARDAGIVFDLKFTLTCEYIARPIGGINSKAILQDILSNCMEIASPDAAFWGGGYKWMIKPHMYPFKNTKFKNTIMDDLYKGKIFGSDGALAHTVYGVKTLGDNGSGSFEWSNVVKNIGDFIGQGLGAIGSLISNIGSAIFGEGNMFSDIVNKGIDMVDQNHEGEKKMGNLLGNLNEMWRSQVILTTMMPLLNNMRALLTGEPVGNWHLVVGNPLNPIMTIGNLICTLMTVTSNDDIGPDDFPTEIKVTYQIEHGMAREKGSIQSMFNRGNGKIYELPDYIKASSDYETKVDKFTGNQSDAGWANPKFMSIGNMLAANGGSGGYKKYKMDPPKELAVNTNTDNTIIAKFTPVDVNMATSKVENNMSFFGSNNDSRVWIRGVAATRKLMN